jgi:flagellar hook-associated protein 2
VSRALEGIATATGASSYTASVGDETVARSRISDAVLPGVYQVETVSLGSYAITMSVDGLPKVVNPGAESLTTSSSLTLVVNGQSYQIQPAENTLDSLASAINEAGAGVRAVIVNMGSSAAPDYRLSVQGETFANLDIQLNDGSQDLMESLAAGSPVEYRLNGSPTVPISSGSRSVTVAPGLTLDLVGVGETTVTVSRSASALTDALSAFVTSFNAAVDELETHRGKGAGALKGESVITTLGQSLQELAAYSSDSGEITSLASLGLEITQYGKLTFDQTVFEETASKNVDGMLSFLGGVGKGGFLDTASTWLKQLSGGGDSLLGIAIETMDGSIRSQEKMIADSQDRIALLQDTLAARMAAADALIANMEQQVQYMNGLFEAMRSNSAG